ncbi:hypothetical protein VTG60DRAFT_4349 [Thermothelomyces hinnuleus]
MICVSQCLQSPALMLRITLECAVRLLDDTALPDSRPRRWESGIRTDSDLGCPSRPFVDQWISGSRALPRPLHGGLTIGALHYTVQYNSSAAGWGGKRQGRKLRSGGAGQQSLPAPLLALHCVCVRMEYMTYRVHTTAVHTDYTLSSMDLHTYPFHDYK